MTSNKIKPIPSLLEIFDKVNYEYLGGLCIAGIKWAKLRNNGDIPILGWADTKTRIISINKCLQDPDVPTFVIEGIVLHECLHLLYPKDRAVGDGYKKRGDLWHSFRFKSMELRFPLIEKTDKWMEDKLWGVLASQEIRKKRTSA